MKNVLDRRALLKMAGAGVLGAAAGKIIEQIGPEAVNAQDVLTVKGGRLHDVYRSLGDWIFLAPTKLGGGTHAMDLGSGKTLAWIAYWNYGDTYTGRH